MGRPKKCTSTSPDREAAVAHINEKINQIETEIDYLIDSEFGRIIDNRTLLNNTIEEKNTFIRSSKAEIKYLKKNRPPNAIPKIKSLQEKVIQAKRDLREAKKSKIEFEKKRKIGNKIINLLRERLFIAAEKSAWNINVGESINVLKSFLSEKTGAFQSINKLSMLELNAKYQLLKKWFNAQDKGEMPVTGKLRKSKGGYGISPKGIKKSYEYTLADPAKVILMNDDTLKGLSLLKDLNDTLPKKSAKKVKYKGKYAEILNKFGEFLYNNNIMYDSSDVRKHEDLTSDELKENEDKIHELIADLADGRTKYIIPKKLGLAIADKKIFKKYAAIVSYANKSGFNITKDIHTIEISAEEIYYYVTMKRVNNDGMEVYDAYLVPHYIDNNGRTKFYYPITKKGIINGNFLTAMNAEDSKDLTEVMSEGFRQAQVEKIFNGYNVKNEEIKTKGYSQYIPLSGIDLNHKLFQESQLRPGSKTTSVTNAWMTLADIRKLLKEIFDDYQAHGKSTLERISRVLNTYPELKKAIKKKGELSSAETTAYLDKILGVLDFSSMMWINKEGNVETPNMSTGIKENYYPTMYNRDVNFAQMLNARDEMKKELVSLQERTQQLKFLKTDTNDPVEKRNLQKSIIRTDKKIKEYKGYWITNEDGEKVKVPGTIDIIDAEIKLSLEQISREEMPKLKAQSMISYSKHRKLYTRRIKDPDPNVLYGGKRTDINVIPNYIDGIFETTFNNELLASLMEAIPIVDVPVMDYLVEEVKATVGRKDLKAGFLNVDYSNQKILKIIQTVWPNTRMTTDKLHRISSNISTIISGSLLGIPTASQNRLQEVMGGMIEVGAKTNAKLSQILEDDAFATEIAERAGVLDTISTLTDVFLGGMDSQLEFWDGFHTIKDIALLKGQDKLRFTNKALGIRRYLMKLLKNRLGNETNISNEQINNLMDGTFEMVHGIAEGTLTENDIRALEKKFIGLNVTSWVRLYAIWGMGAFAIDKEIPGLKAAKQYLSMTEGEYEMRKLQAVRGAVFYADHLADEENKGNYLHPEALEYARGLVNNTLFQFSLQYFPKAFRGAAGIMNMKFKTYWVKESKRELEYLSAYFKSLRGMGFNRRVEELTKLFNPSKDMPVLGKMIGYDASDVKSFSFKKYGFIPWINPDNMKTDTNTEHLRAFIWSRVLGSFWSVGIFAYLQAPKKFSQWMLRKMGVNMGTMGRGAESTLASLGLRGIRIMLGAMIIGNLDDEDDAENIWRIFFPLYLNVLIDMIRGKDAFESVTALTRIFGQWKTEGLGFIHDVLTDEEDD